MIVENNHFLLVTTYNETNHDQLLVWVTDNVDPKWFCVFANGTSVISKKFTFAFLPEGSKEGWDDALESKQLKEKIIAYLKTYAYEDGGNQKLERARKKFAECVRRGKGTRWAEKAEKELAAFPAGD